VLSAVAPETYALYLSVMFVMALTPGPANVFSIATGIERGPKAALLGVLGMNVAMLVWYAAAALGLTALVKAFPTAFLVLSAAGAAYVGWLGAKSLWAGLRGAGEGLKRVHAKAGSAFGAGFLVQISNPKAILFFTAVLPPFIDPNRPAAPQFAAFAVATIGMDACAMSAYGLAGAALAKAFEKPAFRRGFSIAVGVLLLTAAGLIILRLLE
jgi:threonine/homoserine/homoserine lactone efflux protein